MRERDIQAKVVGYARARRVIARKLDFGEGWPDYMMLYEGRILFIEFKSTIGHLRPLQEHMHKIIKASGFDVAVVNEFSIGQALIDQFMGAHGDNTVVDYSDILNPVRKTK